MSSVNTQFLTDLLARVSHTAMSSPWQSVKETS